MSEARTVNQKIRNLQRTVLLASDASRSVIGEVVDGKLNSIGYCVYGEQSAQQEVAASLGFNGQLRESTIGWYLLGNGYRTYNPRLMRFHSPDSWSPFGGGGLNAYMYCVGDPVNRFDPTGHVSSISRFFINAHRFFFGGADVTGPRSGRHITGLGPMSPEKTDGFGQFVDVAASAAVNIGYRRPPGRHPAIGSTGVTTVKNHPGYALGAAKDGLASINTPRRAQSPSGSGTTSATYSSHRRSSLPTYLEATSNPKKKTGTPLWSAQTFAESQGGKAYAIYPAYPTGAPGPYTNIGPTGGTRLPTTPPPPSPPPPRRAPSFDSSGPSDWSSSSDSSRASSPVRFVAMTHRDTGQSHNAFIRKN